MANFDLTRRKLLGSFAAVGAAGGIYGAFELLDSSPAMEQFTQPLPVPAEVGRTGTRDGIDYYELSMGAYEHQFHPDVPSTTVWGFEGSIPGPIIRADRDQQIKVRFDSSGLPTEHQLTIDDRIRGTQPEDYEEYDGPVPDVRTVIHQHGLNVETASDGQADMWKSPDSITGPRFQQHVHDIPNRQPRLTSTYHDHALGISRLNNYLGLNGFYIIDGPEEANLGLPSGEYDIPLMLQDKSFDDDGSLSYPDEFVPNFAADTAVVNGAAWPYLEVEPRRYRFRLVNQANGRTFSLSLSNESGSDVPILHQFAPDQGYLEEVVPIGPDNGMESLTIAPFERAEVIVDFSGFAGESLTLTNDAPFPFSGGNHHSGGMEMDTETADHQDGDHSSDTESGMNTSDDSNMEMGGDHGGTDAPELPELMQFRVTDSSSGVTDDSTPPTELSLPAVPGYEESAAVETREMTLGMEQRNGLRTHVLNGKTFHDDGDHARPVLHTTEIWELTNNTMHTHPIHLHLVEFRVIGRGPDGTEAPKPNERGPKDVVRVNPDETVRIITNFGDFAGRYPWHCHVLEHEEQAMMRPFEVVENATER